MKFESSFESSVVSQSQLLKGQRVAMLHESTAFGDMRVVRQVEELVAHGACVTVWCGGPESADAKQDELGGAGVEFRHRTRIASPTGAGPVAPRAGQVEGFERWAAEEIAAWAPTVIAHHHPMTLPLGVTIADRLELPLISDFNDMPPETTATRRFGLVARRPWRFYPSRATDSELRRLYPLAAARITVAPALAQELGRRYRVTEPHIVLNVPRITRSSAASSDRLRPTIRERLGLEAGQRLMVYVGNVNPRRNLEGLLAALVDSPGWHLAIVGSAPWRLEKFGLGDRLPSVIQKRVHVIERQPDAALPEFLSSADCGVFIPEARNFNLYNCAPNKFFAMALAGIPLIVTDLPYLSSEVKRLGLGVVVRSSHASVVRDALSHALAMKDEVRSLQPRIAREYAWEPQAERLLAAYREAIASG